MRIWLWIRLGIYAALLMWAIPIVQNLCYQAEITQPLAHISAPYISVDIFAKNYHRHVVIHLSHVHEVIFDRLSPFQAMSKDEDGNYFNNTIDLGTITSINILKVDGVWTGRIVYVGRELEDRLTLNGPELGAKSITVNRTVPMKNKDPQYIELNPFQDDTMAEDLVVMMEPPGPIDQAKEHEGEQELNPSPPRGRGPVF